MDLKLAFSRLFFLISFGLRVRREWVLKPAFYDSGGRGPSFRGSVYIFLLWIYLKQDLGLIFPEELDPWLIYRNIANDRFFSQTHWIGHRRVPHILKTPPGIHLSNELLSVLVCEISSRKPRFRS